MKVVQVAHSLSLGHGGTATVAVESVESLLGRGVEVYLHATDYAPEGQRIAITDLPLSIRDATALHPTAWSPMLYCRGMHQALSATIDNRTIVHVHSIYRYPSYIAGFVALRRDAPLVVQPHGSLDPFLRSDRFRLRRRQAIERLVDFPLLRRADVVLCTSQREADDVVALIPEATCSVVPIAAPSPLKVAPGAADNLRRELGLGSAHLLLFMGRLTAKKRPELAIAALALARGANADIHLVMAGPDDDGMTSQLKVEAEKLGVARHVSWVGMVTGEKKAALLAAADSFVLPSMGENFGIAVMEALSYGTPCVLTAGVDIAKPIADLGAGVLVEASAASIAHAVARWAENPSVLADASHAAHLASELFSWAQTCQQLEELYSSLLRHA